MVSTIPIQNNTGDSGIPENRNIPLKSTETNPHAPVSYNRQVCSGLKVFSQVVEKMIRVPCEHW
jgi:hypothetical protein